MMTKKGQSALEFLLTYGWAIAIVLTTIGVLGYFGILNPVRFLPETCEANAGFNCFDFEVVRVDDNKLSFGLIIDNHTGFPILIDHTNSLSLNSDIINNRTISNISEDEPTTGDRLNCGFMDIGDSVKYPNIQYFRQNEQIVIECYVGKDLLIKPPIRNDVVKLEVNIAYKQEGMELIKVLRLDVFAKIK